MKAGCFRLTIAGAVLAALAYALSGCAALHIPLDREAVTCDDIAKPDCAVPATIIVE